MTNVQKLQRLLKIANMNNYKSNDCFLSVLGILIDSKLDKRSLSYFSISNLILHYDSPDWVMKHSINDIVLDFEQEADSSSFIKALCKASDVYIKNDCLLVKTHNYKQIRTTWAITPSSERLDWLFDTFSHLLN